MTTPSTPRQTGRERLADMKALEARQNRQRKLLILVSAVVVVALVAVAIVWVVADNNRKKDNEAAKKLAANTAFIKDLTTIPASTFDAVGAGDVTQQPKATGGPEDKVGGKPRLLYVGAEFCPFCAMERWALVSALSRFGTWNGLKGAVSGSGEAQLSNLQTLTFTSATYSSPYVAFKGWETADREGQPLQTISAQDEALFKEYNKKGSIPFLLYGGKASTVGGTFDGSSLAGKTNAQIVAEMRKPSSDIAKGAVGSANMITAQVCTLTGQKPANVCTSAGVKAAAANLTVK